MAKEAQSCCLISLSPYKQGTQVYTLGKWAETQPHSLSSLFLHSSLYTTQLHLFQCPSIPMYPIQALVVTQLWSSAPLVRFPRMLTLLMQGPGGVSETSGVTLFEPFNLCLQRETTWGSRNRHLFPPRPQKSSLLFPQTSELSQVNENFLPWSYCLSYLTDYWIMHPAFSLNRNSALLLPHKLME